MKNQTIIAGLVVVAMAILDVSCKKKQTHSRLYDESKDSGLSFYKGKDTIYSPAGGSPHGNFKLKLNAAALSRMDASGKLPAGASFGEGSLIVKEVYSGNTLALYAVMKKDAKSKFSSSGWVWAEIEPDGKILYNVSQQGQACVSCHSTANNRDFTRSFDLH